MTANNPDDKSHKTFCEQCKYFSLPFDVPHFGVCNGNDSEHYRHVLHYWHKSCPQYKEVF